MTVIALRALLVGAGGMGQGWADNLTSCDKVELSGWVDLNLDTVTQAAEARKLSGVYITDDLGKAIAVVKPDFLVDVTIPQAHHQVTIQALKAGVPVIGEKPMADTMEQAREMVEVSRSTGMLYMVSQNRRYDARVQAFRDLVRAKLGETGILNSDFYIGAHFGGFRDEMEHPLIKDMAIHTLDSARFITGADPVAVYCEAFNPSWSWYKGDACATAIFEMTGGIRYTYRGSWCSEGHHTSWRASWRAVGSRGTAVWDGLDIMSADIVSQTGGFHSEFENIVPEVKTLENESIAGSLHEFLHALATGETPMCECQDNIKSLAMVFGAIESARTGARVKIEI